MHLAATNSNRCHSCLRCPLIVDDSRTGEGIRVILKDSEKKKLSRSRGKFSWEIRWKFSLPQDRHDILIRRIGRISRRGERERLSERIVSFALEETSNQG